tara:strand:- start:115 stop:693 length:579 start_codon:yes stop_codon:yes gene_type:complete
MVGETSSLALPSLSEVVLKTGDFDRLKNWYITALGCEPFFTRPRPKETSWTGAQQIAFFKLMGEYPYSQVLGIFEVDGTVDSPSTDPGLHHLQFAHASFDELFDRYDNLKAEGILPAHTWNHGVSTSFYYQDPDGNMAEMNCVNFATEAEFFGYFETESYKKNVSGIEIEAEDYIGRYRSGTPREELVKIEV